MTASNAHRTLDAASGLWLLTKFTPLSLANVADLLDVSRSTLSRIRSGQGVGTQDVSGLCAGVIREAFATDSGIAVACQLMELELREAAMDGHGLGLLTVAQDLHDAIVTRRAKLEHTDQLAMASLAGQIALYGARVSRHAPARQARYRYALDTMLEKMPLIENLFALDHLAAEIDRLLGLRMLLNAFFAAWSLDEIEGSPDRLPRARALAKRLLKAGVSRQALHLSTQLRDPRIVYQVAEIAALVDHHHIASIHLAEAIRLSSGDPARPREWAPSWLTVPVAGEAHFADTLALLEAKELQ